MQAEHANAIHRSLFAGNDFGQANTGAILKVIDQAHATGDGTIYLPVGDCKFAGPVQVDINSSAASLGRLRVTGGGEATLFQADDNNLFVITDTDGGWGLYPPRLIGLPFKLKPLTAGGVA
jgi:hypothetical protein